jgi:hypothetical protein
MNKTQAKGICVGDLNFSEFNVCDISNFKKYNFYCLENVFYMNGNLYCITDEQISTYITLGPHYESKEILLKSIKEEQIDSYDTIEENVVITSPISSNDYKSIYHTMYDYLYSTIFLPAHLFNCNWPVNIINVNDNVPVADNFLNIINVNKIVVTKPLLLKKIIFGCLRASDMGSKIFIAKEGYINNFREHILKHLKIEINNTPNDLTILYNKREDIINPRTLINEKKVLDVIRENGWNIKEINLNSNIPLKKQIELFANAKYYMSVQSASFIWTLFMPDNGTVLELIPYHFYEGLYEKISTHLRPFNHKCVFSIKPIFSRDRIRWVLDNYKIDRVAEEVIPILKKLYWCYDSNGVPKQDNVFEAKIDIFYTVFRDQEIYIDPDEIVNILEVLK